MIIIKLLVGTLNLTLLFILSIILHLYYHFLLTVYTTNFVNVDWRQLINNNNNINMMSTT